MYSTFQLGLKYLRFYLSASNGKGHGMHSPFVFEFITRVLNDKDSYPAYSQVENLRQQLLKNQTILSVEDFGAGSTVDKTNRRSIASIAKNAAKAAKFGQLLYRMARHYQPGIILELGTSLGITTSYLSLAKPDATIITMEGSKSIAETARKNFNTLKLQNISIEEGNFDQILSPAISKLSSIDLAFIDGNHRREPTERYFKQLLPITHNDSILIFDDIHWSADMEQAWKRYNSIHLFAVLLIFSLLVLYCSGRSLKRSSISRSGFKYDSRTYRRERRAGVTNCIRFFEPQ